MSSPSSPPQAGHDRAPPERSRPGGARVVVPSLAISAVLHLLAVLLFPLLFGPVSGPVGDADPSPDPRTRPQGIEVVQLTELPDAQPDEVPEPIQQEPETEPEPEPVTEAAPDDPETSTDEPGEEVAEDRPTVAERLRIPETGDARIWRPIAPERTALTPEERARLRLRGRFHALADSLLSEEERMRAATDWTFTDDEGKRWGISPGQLHLGGITIPMPAFSAPPSIESSMERSELDEIRRGAGTEAVRESWRERAEAIRERRDAERADSTGAEP